ncbi:hypothetical protein DW155_09610 [Lactococcus petauri]|nr:hypothetical protein DW155_09610 [Lactococcus petauri]
MFVVGDIQLSRKLQIFGKLNNVYIFSTNHTLDIKKNTVELFDSYGAFFMSDYLRVVQYFYKS